MSSKITVRVFFFFVFSSVAISLPTCNSAPKNSNSAEDVQFYLWTRLNEKDEDILVIDDGESIEKSHFNPSKETKVQFHGFIGNGKEQRMLDMKDGFLTFGDFNVINVDWEKLAGPDFDEAAHNTKIVGIRCANFVQFLIDSFSLDMGNIHVIGFSFGALCAAHCGKELMRLNEGRKLPRITGLDPSNYFTDMTDDEKLVPTDADFVDVIHTENEHTYVLGDVSFFPNGGLSPQPGCEDEQDERTCSHVRAPPLFTESINSAAGFEAVKCDSWEAFQEGNCDKEDCSARNFMGFRAEETKTGKFYLRTNATSPFAVQLDYHEYVKCGSDEFQGASLALVTFLLATFWIA